ncbi:MAG: class I SAM-dependent methyltransferase [Christensenellaceae bacterium]|jgi:23S rRNA (cytosine1962-C5)-methyltransferase|nr:class I SAM-dependent methyltransferase [Christensenellaceae bacterium]
MKIAENWRDFELIASGNEQKLERWGKFFLLRPDPQAIWNAPFKLADDKRINAVYERSATGGGAWNILKKIPDEWTIEYKNLKFIISPMGFKHTGLFPEQAVNWDFAMNAISAEKRNNPAREIQVLNLFGYTGGATVAAAAAGAKLTHVDASRGMVEVCKRNCKLNALPENAVRFIVDDCVKFCERELRRGKQYDAIIMDPPSFGRGANGEVWKLEADLNRLVSICVKFLSPKPLFILINNYTSGVQPTVIKNVLQKNLAEQKIAANIDCFEIGLPSTDGIVLPAGTTAVATFAAAAPK